MPLNVLKHGLRICNYLLHPQQGSAVGQIGEFEPGSRSNTRLDEGTPISVCGSCRKLRSNGMALSLNLVGQLRELRPGERARDQSAHSVGTDNVGIARP